MQKWEYKVLSPHVHFGASPSPDAQLAALLNIEGEDGWELIATRYTERDNTFTCIYKRPKRTE